MSFDEQPDGDIHGECALEIHKQAERIKKLEVTAQQWREFGQAKERRFVERGIELSQQALWIKELEALYENSVAKCAELRVEADFNFQQYQDLGAASHAESLIQESKFNQLCQDMDRMTEQRDGLHEALTNLLECYTAIIESGETSANWEPDEDPLIIHARAALKQRTEQ